MPRSRRRLATRRRCVPWAAPAQTTRCPSWCPVTAWCGAMAPSDSTSVASKPSTCCSRLSRPHEPPCEEVHAAGVGPAARPELYARHLRGPPAGPTVRQTRLPGRPPGHRAWRRSEEHTSELQSRPHLVCRLLLEKQKLY